MNLSDDLTTAGQQGERLIRYVLFVCNHNAGRSQIAQAFFERYGRGRNVGFYYMVNAIGRLAGTILSGLFYLCHGLTACLWASAAFLIAAGLLSLLLSTRATTGTRSTQLSQAA